MAMDSGNRHQKEPVAGHDKCPYCGSEKRLIAEYVGKLRADKIISDDAFPNECGSLDIPFMDIKKISSIQVPGAIRNYPIMKILFDVCGDCKSIYIIKVEFAYGGVIQQQFPAQRAK